MKSISQIINATETTFTGSVATRSLIEKQIKDRWGESELKNYDPYHTARTFKSWLKLGFKVRKGEKALVSTTFVETKDDAGNVIKKIKRPVYLFYYRQIEPLNQNNN